MLDNSRKWQPEPDWATASLQGPTIQVRSVVGVQRLVSGDLDRFRADHAFGEDVGGLGQAVGERYTVRLARDRLLAVGLAATELFDGWHPEGYAVTSVSSAMRILEMRGAGLRDLLARATTIDPDNPGPSASMPFCGITSIVYFHADGPALRVHVDRGLAAYVWAWLECQPPFSAESRER